VKTTKPLICTVAVAAAFAAASAKGQSLPATLIGIEPGIGVTGTIDNGSFFQEYPSGVMKFTEFEAFCIEPTEGISYGEPLVYQVKNSLSLGPTDMVSRLVGGYLAALNTPLTEVEKAQNAAAVQWAIWEVTTESINPFSLADGNVRISADLNQDTINLANQYLANTASFTLRT
jgi:hypothetical protein